MKTGIQDTVDRVVRCVQATAGSENATVGISKEEQVDTEEAVAILKSRRWRFATISDPNDRRPVAIAYEMGLDSTSGGSALFEALKVVGVPGIRSKTAYVSQQDKNEGYLGYVEPIGGGGYMVGGRENLDFLTQTFGLDIPGYRQLAAGRG